MRVFSSPLALAILCSSRSLAFYQSHGSLITRMRSSKTGSAGDELLRLERILSNRGVGSRTQVAKLIRQGRVSVDGKKVLSGSGKFRTSSSFRVDGKSIDPTKLVAIYHKPVGVISSTSDPWGRPSLENLGEQFEALKSMHPVGRLDQDTSGLLLFCSDGKLTELLLKPSNKISRIYEAIVEGAVDEVALRLLLEKGVQTTDGIFPATLIDAQILQEKVLVPEFPKSQKSQITEEEEREEEEGEEGFTGTPNGNDNNNAIGTRLTICSKITLSVCEGKYRMVRRILHNSGHSVIKLHRLQYGAILLGDVPKGAVRECTPEEHAWCCGLISRGLAAPI